MFQNIPGHAPGGSRFVPSLEAAFQKDYFNRVAPGLRLGLLIAATLSALQAAGWFFQNTRDPQLLPVLIGRPLFALGLLALTRVPGFWRFWQPAIVLLIGLGLSAASGAVRSALGRGGLWDSPSAHLSFMVMLTLYAMVMLTGLARLHGFWTLITLTGLSCTSFWIARSYVALPEPAIQGSFGSVVLPAVIMLTAASISFERLQRSDFLARHLLARERERSESLLRNTLPDAIVDRLMAGEKPIADEHIEVTVLFGDIAGFTPWAAGKSASEVLEFLNRVFSQFDRLVAERGLEKIKTVGDCYMVIAGAPEPREDHLEAATHLALEMLSAARTISSETGIPTNFRIGLHSGPLVAGVIGEKRYLYDVWGDTVNLASRLEAQGVPGEIQVVSAVADRLRGRFRVRRRGEIELKGKGTFDTYFVGEPLSASQAHVEKS